MLSTFLNKENVYLRSDIVNVSASLEALCSFPKFDIFNRALKFENFYISENVKLSYQ